MATTKWEYATVPLLTHATKQILDTWGEDGSFRGGYGGSQGGGQGQGMSHRGRGPKGYSRSDDRIREWVRIARDLGVAAPVAIQPHYNLVHREIEDDIVPVAEELGLGDGDRIGIAAACERIELPVDGGEAHVFAGLHQRLVHILGAHVALAGGGRVEHLQNFHTRQGDLEASFAQFVVFNHGRLSRGCCFAAPVNAGMIGV